MSETIKALFAVALALLLGYVIGHWRGSVDGKMLEQANHNVAATKEVAKSTKQRDVIDHETLKIPDTALDAELSAAGFLRD